MSISRNQIEDKNKRHLGPHKHDYDYLRDQLQTKEVDVDAIIGKISAFQVAIPSWALGAGGTRFGRFSIGGEPRNLNEKIIDIGIIRSLTKATRAISLHIPWDIPQDAGVIKELAAHHGIVFDAMNSNTFQDQPNQKFSYKFGSLAHTDEAVRIQAIQHNVDVINYGVALGSKSLTIWLADGSSFPGQLNFQKALERTSQSLKEIYGHMPADWQLFIEYKPYEPQFYSTVIQDWGTSYLLANECGKRAYTLVDLGHHLPNTNIEQIVATLMMRGKLGGFHFNDSKYGDDDLTAGSIKPYQLFLIFNELIYGMSSKAIKNPEPAWMIDASHNLKDPLEDLIQSLEAIHIAFAQALLVDQVALEEAREENDVARCQEILQDAFRCDVRPLLREARLREGAALYPIDAYRTMKIRDVLIRERGASGRASGL
ncbi:MAG: sugar isomerase [Saprospiraceae bacterium]|nr:sugar isomerase [Saprospiraceae bacterium]